MTELKELVYISLGKQSIEGELIIPNDSRGIVLFAHGSGSSRLSSRNQYVASYLQNNGLATLLLDLLTSQEEKIDDKTSEFRFNIELLATRLLAATDWIKKQVMTKNLPLGYFGASTGAAAALIAASKIQDQIAAVVSRGGRPDLAGPSLKEVRAPTLLIVGGEDAPVIQINQEAYLELNCKKMLEIIPGATHLFEEPGALKEVARLACEWFNSTL